jgi:hypothetical protein
MRVIRYVFFLVALVHGVIYAVVMPPWQAPDEVAHFEYSYLLAALRRPISPADESVPLEHAIIQSLYQFHAWQYTNGKLPPVVPDRLSQTSFGRSRTLDRFSLTYVVYALAGWPFIGQGVLLPLYAMRLAAVVMGALVVVLAFETALLVSPGQLGFAAAVAGFVLFLPQHAFINATVSDGNLAELAASACIWLIASMWRQGLRCPPAAACLACAVAAILSKPTAYFLVGLILVVGPVLILRAQAKPPAERSWKWRQFAVGGLVVGCLGAVLVPVIAYAPPLQYIRSMIGPNMARLADFGPYILGLNASGRFEAALKGTFRSFWATFGWMTIGFPERIYQTLTGVTLIALGGLVWRLRSQKAGAKADRRLFLVQALAAVLAIAVLITWFVTSPNGVAYYQGRYLFGAIVPIAIVLVSGWLALVPPRFQPQSAVFVVMMMALFDAAAIFTLALPYFYPAGLA